MLLTAIHLFMFIIYTSLIRTLILICTAFTVTVIISPIITIIFIIYDITMTDIISLFITPLTLSLTAFAVTSVCYDLRQYHP